MANETTRALKEAAEKISNYVKDIATMTVETRFVDISSDKADLNGSKPAASTIIRLDGDCSAVVPMRKNEAGVLQVDAEMFELHERNVAAAVEYRTKMMNALLQALKGGQEG